jgi:threonine aldolase
MTNQIAIKVHTQPLDEVICDVNSHIFQYEGGAYAFHSGVSINTLIGMNGKITAPQIEAAIRPAYDWLPISKLVVLENTCNKGGGSYYLVDEIKPISKLCRSRKLALHLDGARIFNALVETKEKPEEIGTCFDSISICLSKGLGAPVGSLLIGNTGFIRTARRIRKVMGGGMRQAGYLAAAGIYALDHHVDRLKEDNDRAKLLGESLKNLSYVDNVRPVKSNIVIFDIKPPWTGASFIEKLAGHQILAAAFGPQTVRFVTHLDISQAMIEEVIQVLNSNSWTK